MIIYILKSILCSALFIAAYYLILEKERKHRFKRWYLLTTLLLSLGIPLLTIEVAQPELVTQVGTVSQYVAEYTFYLPEESHVTPENTSTGFSWSILLLIGYGVITAVLLVRILNNFLSILADVGHKPVVQHREAVLVLHEKYVIPYSFLNYIFISPQDVNDKHILLHELTHIRQKHTLDILLVEFIHCLVWFSPVMIFYKKAIRLNHEFLADEVVIKNYPTSDYQSILLQKTQTSNRLPLTSSFNYSATKKRFIMMTVIKNQTRACVKITLSCLLLICIAVVLPKKVYAQDAPPLQVGQQHDTTGIAIQKVSEFDSLICKYMRCKQTKTGENEIWFNITGITDGEKTRMKELYNIMTDQEKANYPANIYMIFTSPAPPKKSPPTTKQMADLADPTVYGIWLDGKRIPNAELAKYKPSDIAIVRTSRLMKNAAHYGQYKFDTDVMTHAYFDKTYPPKSN